MWRSPRIFLVPQQWVTEGLWVFLYWKEVLEAFGKADALCPLLLGDRAVLECEIKGNSPPASDLLPPRKRGKGDPREDGLMVTVVGMLHHR